MTRSSLTRVTTAMVFAILAVLSLSIEASAQRRLTAKVQHLSICGNPKEPCKTTATFEPNDLPFRLPATTAIYDTELFYAIVLKSVKSPADDCKIFVPERERLAAQALFPDHKVFSSRCAEPWNLAYTNTNVNAHFMAVYAGMTLADANRMLAMVQATGKFPGANIRRMRAAFNGT